MTEAPTQDLLDLQQRLEAVPGLDLIRGLQTTAGRIDSLARLLGKYAERHAGSGRLLQETWAAGDLVSAHRLAHSIKGAAGFLGLVELQDRAAGLEAAFREPGTAEDLPERLADFIQANEAACLALGALAAPERA